MSKDFVKVIAVDFDGCLCENSWPEIGDDNPQVIKALLEEQKRGTRLILWTCRTGELLEAALRWCESRGIRFDCVNEPWPELKEQFGNDSRKIFATEYWDDRAVEMPKPHYLNRLAADIHRNAVEHGWWEGERSFGEIVALCHSELSEALEEYRTQNRWRMDAADTASTTTNATMTTGTRADASRRESPWR